jgi:hypothetical protein
VEARPSARYFSLEPPSCGSSDRQTTKGLETDQHTPTDPELLETFVQKGFKISIILINITDARHGEYIVRRLVFCADTLGILLFHRRNPLMTQVVAFCALAMMVGFIIGTSRT